VALSLSNKRFVAGLCGRLLLSWWFPVLLLPWVPSLLCTRPGFPHKSLLAFTSSFSSLLPFWKETSFWLFVGLSPSLIYSPFLFSDKGGVPLFGIFFAFLILISVSSGPSRYKHFQKTPMSIFGRRCRPPLMGCVLGRGLGFFGPCVGVLGLGGGLCGRWVFVAGFGGFGSNVLFYQSFFRPRPCFASFQSPPFRIVFRGFSDVVSVILPPCFM